MHIHIHIYNLILFSTVLESNGLSGPERSKKQTRTSLGYEESSENDSDEYNNTLSDLQALNSTVQTHISQVKELQNSSEDEYDTSLVSRDAKRLS